MEESQYYAIVGSHNFHLGVGFPNKVGTTFSTLETIDNFTQQFTEKELVDGGYTTPQFTLRYEYVLTEELGIGANFGYWEARTPNFAFGNLPPLDLGGIDDVLCETIPALCEVVELVDETLTGSKKVRSYSISGQLTYHKRVFPKIDSYATAAAGYNFVREKNVGDPRDKFKNINLPTFVYFTSVGLRYYINPKLGIYGEIGYGNISNFNAGLTVRIP